MFVAGLGTGGTLMGCGRRLREANPDVQVVAAEPLQGEDVMGLRSLEDGYVPQILDLSQLDRQLLVSNDDSLRGLRLLARDEGIFAGVSSGGVLTRRAARRARARPRREHRHGLRRRRREVRRPASGTASEDERSSEMESTRLVVIAAARCPTRSWSHARARPARRGVRAAAACAATAVVEFRPGAQRARQPARATPIIGRTCSRAADIEDGGDGSSSCTPMSTSPATRRRPTSTIAQQTWPDALYLIVSLATDPADLRAYRLAGREVAEVDLAIA